MTRVVVTGGAGFIGSNLVATLVDQGYEVCVLDDLSTGREENLADVRQRIEFVRGEVEDQAACQRALQGARFVWHLAALGSVPRSVADPLASNRANVTGTLSVLWTAQNCGVERVVFASSSSVYGRQASLPQMPDAKLNPSSPYAATKLAGEHYMRVFWECFGLQTVCLRFFNVFGPRQDPESAYAAVIPSFLRSLLHGRGGVIHGDGDQSRDFTYVEDCVQATIKAMTAALAAGRVYNVACSNQTTINELYRTLCALLQVDIAPIYADSRAGDVRHSRADITRTIADIGYRPQYSLASGLAQALPWYREHFERENGIRRD
jgi:nucleoside-diphosphate-sugar epimerase